MVRSLSLFYLSPTKPFRATDKLLPNANDKKAVFHKLVREIKENTFYSKTVLQAYFPGTGSQSTHTN
jgi:hypothetical protein